MHETYVLSLWFGNLPMLFPLTIIDTSTAVLERCFLDSQPSVLSCTDILVLRFCSLRDAIPTQIMFQDGWCCSPGNSVILSLFYDQYCSSIMAV